MDSPGWDVIGIATTDGLCFTLHVQFRFPLQHDPPLSLVVMSWDLPRAICGKKTACIPCP